MLGWKMLTVSSRLPLQGGGKWGCSQRPLAINCKLSIAQIPWQRREAASASSPH